MSLAPITGDGGKLAAQAADQTQKTTPVQEFQGILKNGLNAIKEEILCVRGNCDTEVDQMVLEFPVLAEYCLLYLDHITIFATHGHKFNKNFMPNLAENEVLLHGHTHVPACEKVGNNMYMNPGSVSIPKENSHHGYMTIEDGRFLWKDLDGNIKNSYPSA